MQNASSERNKATKQERKSRYFSFANGLLANNDKNCKIWGGAESDWRRSYELLLHFYQLPYIRYFKRFHDCGQVLKVHSSQGVP